ncbi:MAG: hypothetical protein IAE66_04845 [Xanthomonadaceae bacterium]|nr:hypothetical protein [Xanthomonadaceae bacterium]
MKPVHLVVLGLAVLAAPVIAQTQGATTKKLYCWDEGGRRVCGDALPTSAVNSARTEISKTGMPGAHIDRALTPEERAAQAAQQAQVQALADAAAAEARSNNALAESYESEDALRRAFNIRYELVDEGMKTSRLAIQNQRQALLQMLQAAADVEMKNGKVPARLAQNVMTQRASVVDAVESYRIQQQERVELDGKLEDALVRYRKAKGLDPATGQAPAAPPAPLEAQPPG